MGRVRVLSEDALRAILDRAGIEDRDLVWSASGASSFHATYRVETTAGRYFLKYNAHGWPRHFEAEAAGLRALAAEDTALVVPEVLSYADDEDGGSHLLMTHLELGKSAGSKKEAWAEHLGRGLARLHAPDPSRSYGFAVDGYCGSTPQPNPATAEWVEFYGQHRLAQLGRRARQRGLDPRVCQRLEELVDRLDEWIGMAEGPALIHGDLWSGNALATASGEAAVVDPAAYWGEREAELGMMSLFGGFPPRVWEAYRECRPLRPGWRQRLGIYELYHLLNHFVIFGGGYAGDVDRTLRHYVG